MTGISVPDDAKSFYAPILQWVEKYVREGVSDPMVIIEEKKMEI
jgi:hypothetical protein